MKAIQATFYSQAKYVTQQLRANGFQFICRDIFNNFHGTEVTVIIPSGKGRMAKVNLVEAILGNGINVYLSPTRFYQQFPNHHSLLSYNTKIGA